MSMDSPVSILFDVNGVTLPVANGVATPASTPALMVAGSDGTTSRYIGVDSSGRTVTVGAGTAGTPAGGILSIQGVSGGFALPVSGTVTATVAAVGATGAAVPASAAFIGISDGTNLVGARGFDLDSGAGFEYNLGVSLRIPGSGGSVAGGTVTNPLRVDVTGTTTQPVSAAALPLPSGAATETTLAGVLTTTNFQARIGTLGQKAMAGSTPVVLASDQSAVQVTGAKAATATLSNVSSSATVVTILALNASRLGACVFNDSNKVLYLKFGSGASATSFTVRVPALGNYEVPFGYTGVLTGLWDSVNGSARVTELTA
jgi:hypothetical protein